MRISEMCVIMTERRRRQNTLRDFRFIIINGFLYLLGTEGNLIQVSPDGSERKRITKVYDYDGTSNTKLVFYENAVLCV